MTKQFCFFIIIIVFGFGASGKAQKFVEPPPKYNILFIAVDDLKPLINSFGAKQMYTPHIDALAARSTIFKANYCQQAVCAPTRASLLTGLRPDKTKVWDLETLMRDKNPDITTLPQYLKANGYRTMAMGKIFDSRSVDKEHDAVSWSIPYTNKFTYATGYENAVVGMYHSAEMKAKLKALRSQRSGNSNGDQPIKPDDIKITTESADVPDDAYFDGAMTNYAIQQLKKQKDAASPFFMAVGFHKPHLPFVAPKKYWDLYDRNKIELAGWQKKSANGPDVAYHNAGELRSFKDTELITETSTRKKSDPLNLPVEKQKELIHGYYACISYLDAQIGKLMDALKAEGLDKNTIVVFWGDHGWHLGDHSLWAKHSNFEQATNAPLMFCVPNVTKGNVYSQPTEFVDIFPTLCDLTGIPLPGYLDGKSLVPALKNNKVKLKEYAISQYPRGGSSPQGKAIMGYSLRTERYRYTEWIGSYFTTAKMFDQSQIVAVELYDLTEDPGETTNLAGKPEAKQLVSGLADKLHAYYKQQYTSAGKIK